MDKAHKMLLVYLSHLHNTNNNKKKTFSLCTTSLHSVIAYNAKSSFFNASHLQRFTAMQAFDCQLWQSNKLRCLHCALHETLKFTERFTLSLQLNTKLLKTSFRCSLLQKMHARQYATVNTIAKMPSPKTCLLSEHCNQRDNKENKCVVVCSSHAHARINNNKAETKSQYKRAWSSYLNCICTLSFAKVKSRLMFFVANSFISTQSSTVFVNSQLGFAHDVFDSS